MPSSCLLVAPGPVVMEGVAEESTADYVGRAFRRLGWSVERFDYRAEARRLGVRQMNEYVRTRALNGHDLVLVLKGELLEPGTFTVFAKHKLRNAVWDFDPRFLGDASVLARALEVETFFTIGGGAVQHLRGHGVNAVWLLEGADPQVHVPVEGVPRTFEVSWIGTIEDGTDRRPWLERIAKGFDLHCWGSCQGEPIAGATMHGRAVGDAVHNAVVSASRIVLGRDRNPEIVGSVGARLFRTLAAGGRFLTNQTVLGIPVWTYESDEGCVRILHDLLAEEVGELEKVAEEGRAEVLRKHTFDHRVKELLRGVGL